MLTMGSDFNYENALQFYKNLDKLIKYVNKDGTVHAFYSTPSIYTKAKLNTPGVSYSLKTDDFFPYSDWINAYWTGYFTSRPALKRFVRYTSAYLQVTQIIRLHQNNSTHCVMIAI
jgi:hypothetical protein